jgi:PAS domain S-box-containing protein
MKKKPAKELSKDLEKLRLGAKDPVQSGKGFKREADKAVRARGTGTMGNQINSAQQRLEAMIKQASLSKDPLLNEALENLSASLAELSVSEEELHQQNEELLASRQVQERERQHYQELFDFTPDGYLVTTTRGIIKEANRAAGLQLGVPQDYLQEKPLRGYIKDRKSFDTLISRFQKTAKKAIEEWEGFLIPRKKGAFYARIIVAPIEVKSGRLIGLRWLIRDITKRKKAEDEIRHTEARLEALLKISQYRHNSIQALLDFALEKAIALTGSQIGYIYHYDETKKEFNLNSWSREVMKQCTITEPQTVYQLAKTGLWGEAVRQAKPILVNDFQAAHSLKKGYPEGHAPLYKYMTVPVFFDDRIVGVVGVANKETDYDTSDVRQLTLLMDAVWKILELKRAEEILRGTEERYRNLFESMGEAFVLCEMIYDKTGKPIDFRHLDVNPAYFKMMGLPVERVLGRTVKEVIPTYESFWIEALDRVVKNGQSERIEHTVAELGRDYEVYAWRSDVGRFAAVFKEVTERKKLEEALRQSRDELENRVQKRTTELALANEGLIIEIEERRRAETALLESKKQLRLLASQLVTAQENERKRIALEVHDVLGSSLSAIKFKVEDVLQRINQGSPLELSEHLEALIPIIRDTVEEARRIQSDLRPPLLDDLGIIATLDWFCRRFQTIYSDVHLKKSITIQEDQVPASLKISIFRIAQEAMNNIGKHAKASLVHFGLKKIKNTIELTLRDNGKGFDTKSLFLRDNSEKGLGLLSMKERIELLGGSFKIESTLGKGTLIIASWPV